MAISTSMELDGNSMDDRKIALSSDEMGTVSITSSLTAGGIGSSANIDWKLPADMLPDGMGVALAYTPRAQGLGANYVAFGSIYNSKTKLDSTSCSIEELTNLVKEIHISTVAIGGIDTLNINNLAISKVDLVASSSGLFEGDISNNYKSLFSAYSSSW